MGVPLPTNETFDGKSVASVVVPSVKLASDQSTLRQWALSQFMRCPPENASEKDFWEGQTCLFVDRAQMQVRYYYKLTVKTTLSCGDSNIGSCSLWVTPCESRNGATRNGVSGMDRRYLLTGRKKG